MKRLSGDPQISAAAELRRRAVEARLRGEEVGDIADVLGVHWGTVSRWLTEWRRGGEQIFQPRPRSGRPHTLDCKVWGARIVQIVGLPATAFGCPTPLWTCRRIRDIVNRELKLRVSVPTIWRGLRRLKLSCQKPERRAAEQDPKARAHWLRYQWPAIRRAAARKRALVFFQDESGIHLAPNVGTTWAPEGKTPTIEVTGRRGCICAMSAVSPDGKLFFSIPKERVNAKVFIAFLSALLREYPRRKIFVICDQARPHTAKATKEFAASQARLTVHYLPPYSPDYNPDEKVWNHLKHHELVAHSADNTGSLRRKASFALRRMSKRPPLVRSFFHRSHITGLL